MKGLHQRNSPEYAKAHQKKLLTEESETRQEILARFGLEKT